MTESIQYEQFDQTESPAMSPDSDSDLRRLSDVPMELSVEIGRTQMTVGETLELRVGSIVTLERLAGEPVDLLVNGTPIARGEVVVVDEQFGLRVTAILEAGESPPHPSPGDQPPDDGAATDDDGPPATDETNGPSQ